MSEEEIFKTLEKACILDKNCYEVDCLLEETLIAIRDLVSLYKEQKETIKSLETENKALKGLYTGTQEFKDICKWLEA